MPTASACKVSRAQSADLEPLSSLFAAYLEFYQVAKPLADIRVFLAARLERGDSVIFVCKNLNGELQGFVQLYAFFASLELRPAFLLSDLYVRPPARRSGAATALMNAAREYAGRQGACGLMLETARSNLAAQALYQRLGYVRDEVFSTWWLGNP